MMDLCQTWFTSYYLRFEKGQLRCEVLSYFVLFENMEVRVEQSVALAYVLCLYKLHQLYISDWKLGTQWIGNHQKMIRYVIANIRKVVLVLVNFQNKMLQYRLLDYILVSISRVVIWNITTKWVTLISSDSQISREKCLQSCFVLVRTFKVTQLVLIYIEKI